MSAIKSIRLKNLRCLKNTNFIDIKPITVLVGKNSAGKSTFARTFPLLRQSAEEEKRAPILWYGKLVDFGDFKTALNRYSDEKEISFSFKLNLAETGVQSPFQSKRTFFKDDWGFKLGESCEVIVTLNLCFEPSTSSTFASSIEMEIFGNSCTLKFSDSKTLSQITVNDFTWEPGDVFRSLVTQKNIAPEIRFARTVTRKVDGDDRKYLVMAAPLKNEILKILSRWVHANTKTDTLSKIATNISLGSDEDILKSLRTSLYAPATFIWSTKNISASSNSFVALKNFLFASALPQLLDLIDIELADFFQGVRYIEPLRATAQRYYRRQELAVDEIDSKGTNVAMYFDSLAVYERHKLNQWLLEYFGFELIPRNDGGHIELSSRSNSSNTPTNLADLGVGVSQILPIVLQLWQAANPNYRRSRTGISRLSQHPCIVIEQPELHLHPAYQAKIADIFLAAIGDGKLNSKNISIIAETHSPHLINRLGELVADGQINKDDVQIVIFEDSEDLINSSVSISKFNEDGILTNWPFGFFEPY